ncbi:MAG: cupin domain-containing protein [Thermoanaerobaculales bacterium]|jgi:quercetin dioxygenase-like cupin family protein|nr:cupin domain-containing protein [Thermoanaerobaculales bacterium]
MSDREERRGGKGGSLPPAQVQKLDATVEVADGAVVSRTLMKTDGGTVTVFAFDEGQSLSEHTAPFDALVQVLEGTLTVTIDGRAHSLGAGDAVLMPADIPHGVDAPSKVKWMLVMLKAGAES